MRQINDWLEIHYEIDEPCLLKCIHCSSKKNSNVPQTNHSYFIDFLNHFAEKKMCIYITGGEPLLSDSLIGLLRSIKNYKQVASIGINSSGVVSNSCPISTDYAVFLKKIGIAFFYISLYSYTSEVHDSITRIKGSFNNTVISIKNIIKAGIVVNIHYVPMKKIIHIDKMLSFFNELGISEVRYLRLVKHGKAKINWGYIGLSDYEQFNIAKHMDISIKSYTNMNLTIAGFPEFWNCRPIKSRIKCQAGISLLYIDKYGDIYPCACKKNDKAFLMGNISNLEDFDFAQNKKYNSHCLQGMNKKEFLNE
jgi:MoaA/NifB/PqqE/SkfB family radical SAM enzyme